MEKEIIKIDERQGYPMYCKASKVDKSNEVEIEFVVDGDKNTIIPGQHEISCSFLGLLKIDVLEVLEERPARGQHSIQNPIYYKVRGLVLSKMRA